LFSYRPNERIREQLAVTGIAELIGSANIYGSDQQVGASVRRAYEDALVWVETNQEPTGSTPA
jgi:hypothetical protein